MKKKATVAALLLAVLLLALVPLFALRGAEFGGSDDAAGDVVAEVNASYEPWAAPVLETLIGGELPGEVESLFFCVQTGVGAGVIAFFAGRFVERRKWQRASGGEKREAAPSAALPEDALRL